MRKILLKIIRLIPVKVLAKYLPDIMAYILTKVLRYVLTKYPNKSAKVIETTEEISKAMIHSVKIAKTGVITPADIEKQKNLWKDVFK